MSGNRSRLFVAEGAPFNALFPQVRPIAKMPLETIVFL